MSEEQAIPRKLRHPLPQKCIKCNGELFVMSGAKVNNEMKFGDTVVGVLLFCNGECQRFVAECLGKTTNWYVESNE